jgi:hypothetical protein
MKAIRFLTIYVCSKFHYTVQDLFCFLFRPCSNPLPEASGPASLLLRFCSCLLLRVFLGDCFPAPKVPSSNPLPEASGPASLLLRFCSCLLPRVFLGDCFPALEAPSTFSLISWIANKVLTDVGKAAKIDYPGSCLKYCLDLGTHGWCGTYDFLYHVKPHDIS